MNSDWPNLQGIALDLTSHGIGAARAFQISEMAGVFLGQAMGLNGLMTALLVLLMMRWMG